jgi:hypothetical protein
MPVRSGNGLVNFRVNRAGIAGILKSETVRLHLYARAQRAAAVAQARYDDERLVDSGRVHVFADSQIQTNRARAAVVAIHPAVVEVERDHHVLAQALDAAKG